MPDEKESDCRSALGRKAIALMVPPAHLTTIGMTLERMSGCKVFAKALSFLAHNLQTLASHATNAVAPQAYSTQITMVAAQITS